MSPLVPPGARAEFVTAAGGQWRTLRPAGPTPDATPALLIHGGGFDHAGISWFHHLVPLGRERPVVAPDLPGFGGTTTVPLRARADLVADQLVALLNAVGLTDRLIVVGVSMGGDIALRFALRHPERTAAVVAIAPGGLIGRFHDPVTNWLAWLATRLPDRGMDLLARATRPWAKRSLMGAVADPTTLPPELVTEFLAEARRPGAGVAYGAYNRASIAPTRMTNNLLPYLAGVSAPALFFHGVEDRLVPLSGSEAAAALMPNAHLVRVPGCGHWAQLERPAEFLSAWREFTAALPHES